MNSNGLPKFAKQVINEYRQTGDVIHVRMGHDDITDGTPLGFTQGDANAARVDRHAIIDHKASQALRRVGAALGIERTW